MQKRHLIAATVFAAALPALAGTVAMTAAKDDHKKITARDDAATEQKYTPAVKPGGLLNTTVPPRDAKAIARNTNRKIAQGRITPQVSPPDVTPSPAH